jgi:hypothetical protein
MGRVLLGDPAGNVVEDGPPFYDFWDIHVCLSTTPPNKALQPPLAVAMLTFDFMKRFREVAMLASASGG